MEEWSLLGAIEGARGVQKMSLAGGGEGFVQVRRFGAENAGGGWESLEVGATMVPLGDQGRSRAVGICCAGEFVAQIRGHLRMVFFLGAALRTFKGSAVGRQTASGWGRTIVLLQLMNHRIGIVFGCCWCQSRFHLLCKEKKAS